MGAFRHRFNRTRCRQQRREQTIQLVASTNEPDILAAKWGLRASVDFEGRILAKEILALMDIWLRRVWTARQYGYSWKEIAGRNYSDSLNPIAESLQRSLSA